jgi:flagellar basal-body rod protein FlgF
MTSGIYSALSGAVAKMQQLEVTLHNLANVGNKGFKAGRVTFESLVDNYMQNNKSRGVNFTRTAVCYNDFSQGDIEKTDLSLDLAIQGQGFFKVAGEDGFFYTRQGNFRLDNQGNLVTSERGLQVVGEDGPLNFPHSDVVINHEGIVTADGEEIGRVTVYEVPENQDLIRKGDGLWELKPGVTDRPSGNAGLLQGNLERSNANPLLLTTELIETKRAYAAYMNTMKIFGEIGEKTREIGKIG